MIQLLLVITQAFAAQEFNLKVESKDHQFDVSIRKSIFEFKSKNKNVKETIKKCNALAFENFSKKIQTEIEGDPLNSVKKKAPSIHAKLGKKSYEISPLSTSGILLSQLETEVDYLIGEAKYRCSK